MSLNILFFIGGESRKVRRLKKGTYPTQNLPQIKMDVPKKTSSPYEARLKSRLAMIESQEKALSVNSEDECENAEAEFIESREDEIIAVDALLQLATTTPRKTFRDFQVQVNTPKIVTLTDIITTDKILSSFTGLQTFSVLDSIVNNINIIYKDARVHRLNIKDRVIIVFIKLKLNLSYIVISSLFGITPDLCRTYFMNTLKILSKLLSAAIYFPSKEEIAKNMPKCFTDFKDTQIILDCTEIPIQRTKCLCCRIKFYSHYKGIQTIKILTGVSPGGLVTFISKPFGGRASDKVIFQHSNLISMLDKNCAIMADKGFFIDKECQEHGIKLYRPPF